MLSRISIIQKSIFTQWLTEITGRELAAATATESYIGGSGLVDFKVAVRRVVTIGLVV